MTVTAGYRDAWSAVASPLDDWLRMMRANAFSHEATVAFARIQADIADAIREALDAEGIDPFVREGIVLDTLKRFRLAAALVHAGSSDDIIKAQVKRALGVGLVRAETSVTTIRLQEQRETSRIDMREAGAMTWTWKAKLDAKTCAYCITMHGTEHPIDKPLLSHPNCRCLPVTGVTGVTGWTWLRRAAKRVQDAVLHPLVAEAWRAGKLSPDIIVDPTKMRRRPLYALLPHIRKSKAYRTDRRRR